MVRSLWTGAQGMLAQQLNVDNIANNIANVNTTGYKTEVMEFKSLLYQDIQTETTSENGEDNKPIGAEVGLGVRNSSIMSVFTQGSLLETDLDTDFAINGNGFFAVRGEDGEVYYTRNGHFTFAEGTDGMMLCDSDGRPVYNSEGEVITLDESVLPDNITFDKYGTLYYPNSSNVPTSLGVTIGLFQFNNPAGLSKTGDSLYQVTDASGAALSEVNSSGLTRSTLKQGYLEGSNVQLADEMVNLIVAQRAYEMNSKIISTSDDMLQTANNLKR